MIDLDKIEQVAQSNWLNSQGQSIPTAIDSQTILALVRAVRAAMVFDDVSLRRPNHTMREVAVAYFEFGVAVAPFRPDGDS